MNSEGVGRANGHGQIPFHVGVSGTALEGCRARGAGAGEGEDVEILRTDVGREAGSSAMSGVVRSGCWGPWAYVGTDGAVVGRRLQTSAER